MLEYSRPKKEKFKRKSKGGSRINACQKRMMKLFKIKPEHQRLVSGLKPPSASNCGKLPPIPQSPSYITLQIRAFPPPARTLETVHHWLVWWPETNKVNEWKYRLRKHIITQFRFLLVVLRPSTDSPCSGSCLVMYNKPCLWFAAVRSLCSRSFWRQTSMVLYSQVCKHTATFITPHLLKGFQL